MVKVSNSGPNHLNFGLRYAWISSDLLYAAGETFEVFTINHYNLEPDVDMIEALAARTRRPTPILITRRSPRKRPIAIINEYRPRGRAATAAEEPADFE